MEAIVDYANISDLKRKIILQYVKELEFKVGVDQYLLKSKDWASTGSEYHVRLRKETQDKLTENLKQIKRLKS